MPKAQKSKYQYYQVVTKHRGKIMGAFPLGSKGLSAARIYAEKQSLETGEKCVVKKK